MGWKLELASKAILHGKKIILSIGGDPKELRFAEISTISLKTALNLSELESGVGSDDDVAVFGSAQSAKSVIESLSRLKQRELPYFIAPKFP